MTDAEIIEYAQQAYAAGSGDNIIIQEPSSEMSTDQIVDRVQDESAAWVMAWVYVPIEEGDE